ncbi:MAG: hypothetical protein LLG44_02185 [Chloroflexi bacterium]|nr:hypothetical protein [Chloroflexota bacterium]
MANQSRNKKQQVLDELFSLALSTGSFTFDNELVKEVSRKLNFGNPFDVTKLDNSEDLSPSMIAQDYCIIHLGQGKHRFIKGISTCYHVFEKIGYEYAWNYRQSILNELDTSESNILSVASNQRVLHDFLYEDIVASPKVYNARRTKLSFSYFFDNALIELKHQQMEIDLTMEYNGTVTVVEGKNGFPKDFNVYQLYYPYRYYSELKMNHDLAIDNITCCYILRVKNNSSSILRLYNYTFTDINRINSIVLKKAAQYTLVRR